MGMEPIESGAPVVGVSKAFFDEVEVGELAVMAALVVGLKVVASGVQVGGLVTDGARVEVVTFKVAEERWGGLEGHVTLLKVVLYCFGWWISWVGRFPFADGAACWSKNGDEASCRLSLSAGLGFGSRRRRCGEGACIPEGIVDSTCVRVP